MNFHVLTLFPDMIEAGLHTSVTGRALKNGYSSECGKYPGLFQR